MISHCVRDFHHGQLDCSLLFKINDVVVGYLDYSVYEDKPAIQMVKVDKNFRRNRIATQLLLALQARHPETEIDWGSLSGNGVSLKTFLPVTHLPTPEAPLFEKLKRMRATLKRKEEEIETLHRQNAPSGEAIQAYYDLEQDIDDLAWDLRDKHPYAIILQPPTDKEPHA